MLKVYHFPATLTAFQFGCGTVMILVMWGLNLYPKPKISKSQVNLVLKVSCNFGVCHVSSSVSIVSNISFQFVTFYKLLTLNVGAVLPNIPACGWAHHRKPFNKHQFGESGSFIHTHHQGDGALLHCLALCHFLRRGMKCRFHCQGL